MFRAFVSVAVPLNFSVADRSSSEASALAGAIKTVFPHTVSRHEYIAEDRLHRLSTLSRLKRVAGAGGSSDGSRVRAESKTKPQPSTPDPRDRPARPISTSRGVSRAVIAMCMGIFEIVIATATLLCMAGCALSLAKKRVLVIYHGGRREWLSATSDDDFQNESPCYTELDGSTAHAQGDERRSGTICKGGLAATVGGQHEDRLECRIAACAVARRAVCCYMALMKRGVTSSSLAWWSYDQKRVVQTVPDPDGVLVAIATLARRYASLRSEEMALGDTRVSDEVAAASVGVGHKLASCMECLHVSKGYTLAASIARELGVCVGRDPQLTQMKWEAKLASHGFAFSCAAYNLSCTCDAVGLPSELCVVDDILLRAVARVLNVALMIDYEFRMDLVVNTHGTAAVEAAFSFAVREVTRPFRNVPHADAARGPLGPIRDVAFLIVHAGVRTWHEALSIMLPPGHAEASTAVLNVFARGDPFRAAVCRLS